MDFQNAFNEVSRLAFLLFFARDFPALFLAAFAAYGAPTFLSAPCADGFIRFLSQRGATQGCSLGSLAFASALQEVLEWVRT